MRAAGGGAHVAMCPVMSQLSLQHGVGWPDAGSNGRYIRGDETRMLRRAHVHSVSGATCDLSYGSLRGPPPDLGPSLTWDPRRCFVGFHGKGAAASTLCQACAMHLAAGLRASCGSQLAGTCFRGESARGSWVTHPRSHTYWAPSLPMPLSIDPILSEGIGACDWRPLSVVAATGVLHNGLAGKAGGRRGLPMRPSRVAVAQQRCVRPSGFPV